MFVLSARSDDNITRANGACLPSMLWQSIHAVARAVQYIETVSYVYPYSLNLKEEPMQVANVLCS